MNLVYLQRDCINEDVYLQLNEHVGYDEKWMYITKNTPKKEESLFYVTTDFKLFAKLSKRKNAKSFAFVHSETMKSVCKTKTDLVYLGDFQNLEFFITLCEEICQSEGPAGAMDKS